MALYKHVTNKEQLLDGMVDTIVGEIDPPVPGIDWKRAIRQRMLSARRTLLRHAWGAAVLESRENPTPNVIAYMDSMIGMLRKRGLSVDLTHHVMHAMGSRLLGFSHELFNDSASPDPQVQAEMQRKFAGQFPYITELVAADYHDAGSVVGGGCDDQYEFEFALDLLLNGIERLKPQDWRS